MPLPAKSSHHPTLDDTHEWRMAQDARLSTFGGELSSVRSEITAVKTDIASVKEGQLYTNRAIGDLTAYMRESSRPRETQWGVLISLCALIVLIAGGYATLITVPSLRNIMTLEEQAVRTDSAAMVNAKLLGENAQWHASAEREKELMVLRVDRVEARTLDNATAAAFEKGKLQAMQEQLNAIDTGGSRYTLGRVREMQNPPPR